jgi:nicotinamidase-related amidase
MRIHVYGEPRDIASGFDDYLDAGRTAVVSIDMHRGHLDPSPECPCPAPRARDIVAPIDAFHGRVRALGIPIIHVRSALRRGGVDDIKGISAAWRRTFPLYDVGGHPEQRCARDRRLALDRICHARRASGPASRDQEAALGLLSNRPRLSSPEHAHRDRRAQWRVYGLLRAQHGIRCQQPQLPCDRCAGPGIEELERVAQAPVSLINTRFPRETETIDLRTVIDRRNWATEQRR